MWTDAVTAVPWSLYGRFGDVGMRARLKGLCAWVNVLDRHCGAPRGDQGFGSGGRWVAASPLDQPVAAKNAVQIAATGCFAGSAQGSCRLLPSSALLTVRRIPPSWR